MDKLELLVRFHSEFTDEDCNEFLQQHIDQGGHVFVTKLTHGDCPQRYLP